MDSIPKKMEPGDEIFINPSVSERSVKKRRVTPGEEEEEEEAKTRFKQGNHVDVKVLLSSETRNFLVTSKGGQMVPIAALDTKFVMVACLRVPFELDGPESSFCQSIEALYSELTFKGIADRFQLVLVPKISPGFGKAEFDSFFSRLSLNCLAVPFSDSKSRDKICKSFGWCSPDWGDQFLVPCLVVHPNGKVLQFDPLFLLKYGARSFPFTEEHFDDIIRQDKIIRNRIRSRDSPIFLEELLQCDYLSRIANENDYIPTSALGDTPVALYICCNGSFMAKLQDIHQKCFDKRLKFEVVLVPLPFDHYETPLFRDLMKQEALKHSRSSSWWMFPFDDKVYRTLSRLIYSICEDHLVIVPHGKSLGDLSGKEIVTTYGIREYPFTRDVLINKRITALKSFTLTEFLRNNDMPDLHNKNVLLYLDSPTFFYDGGHFYNVLKREYNEIKAKYADSEVVFVSLQPNLESEDSRISEMEWPILPLELCESIIWNIFPYSDGGACTGLVAFGKDGKILSRRSAALALPVSTSSSSLFDYTLESEIEDEVASDIRN